MSEKKKSPKSSKWGKGKTDPESWWKKGGPSPNPKGRPKGSKNQKTLYEQAFGALVTVNLDGKPKTMSKKELSYFQLAQQAAAGNLKAFQYQKELDEKFDPPEVVPPSPEDSAADFITLDAWIALRQKFLVFQKKNDDNA